MSRRFYLPRTLIPGLIRLEGSEAHHLCRVLRFQAGDDVSLFDGRGTEAQARVESVADGVVILTVLSQSSTAEGSRPAVLLATAVPKGERFDWLVEKSVELGVDRLIPLITARSIVNPGTSKLDRLRRTIIEASKQCGRNQLMELAEPIRWNDFLARETTDITLLVADPSGEPASRLTTIQSQSVLVAVGPEGGFTGEELEQASRAGASLVSIAPWILRIETAAIAFAAVMASGANDRC